MEDYIFNSIDLLVLAKIKYLISHNNIKLDNFVGPNYDYLIWQFFVFLYFGFNGQIPPQVLHLFTFRTISSHM